MNLSPRQLFLVGYCVCGAILSSLTGCATGDDGDPCPEVGVVLDNGSWVVEKLDLPLPEQPFKLTVDSMECGTTKALAFATRVPGTTRFPQVLVVYSSGFLRIKPRGSEASDPPFGQSLVLGPALFGSSTSYTTSTLFYNPQLTEVDVSTSQLDSQGQGTLIITARAAPLLPTPPDSHSNNVMEQRWSMALTSLDNAQTILDIDGTFRFTEHFVPDPVRTAENQSFRLFQLSSMYINDTYHDVNAFRYSDGSSVVTVHYAPELANMLLPPSPAALATPQIDSLHTDNDGLPNGNTPSYRITVRLTEGPLNGPFAARAFITPSSDPNDDNLGLWLFQRPSSEIPAETSGRINLSVVASTDPLDSF